MRITIATGVFAPESGGPATYLKQLIPELKKAGCKLDIVTYGAPRKGVTAISRDSPFRWINFLGAVWKSARKSDLIFTTDTFSAGFPSAIVALFSGNRLVLRFVGDFAWETARNQGWTNDPLELFQKKKYNWKVELMRFIQRWTLRHAEVFTVSEFSKGLLASWGVKAKFVVSNAAKPIALPSKEVLRRKLGLDGKFVIVTVARITRFKGVDKIIKLLAELDEVPDAYFVVVGDGPVFEQVKEVAKELKFDRIRFTGRLDERDTRAYMKAADIFILNSEGEHLPFTVLEAMSVKCPVMASAVGGTTGLVKGRGLLFKYNDMVQIRNCLLQYYNNPKLRAKYANKAFDELPKQKEVIMRVVRFLKNEKK